MVFSTHLGGSQPGGGTGLGTQDSNLIKIDGTAVATGHGTAAGALRVELPTDGTGRVTAVPSGTQDTNLTQVNGVATATGHGTASGAVRVELPTDGTGQVTIVPSGTQSVNLLQLNGTAVVAGHGTAAGALRVELPTDGTGVVGAQGLAASGTAVAGNPVLMGARAATANPTAVANGQAVSLLTDKLGRFINAGFALPETYLDGSITSTATGAATIIASPGTANVINITDLELSNSGTTAVLATFNNTGSTVVLLPPGGGRESHLQTPIKTAAGAAFTFTCAPAPSGGTIYASAQGFSSL